MQNEDCKHRSGFEQGRWRIGVVRVRSANCGWIRFFVSDSTILMRMTLFRCRKTFCLISSRLTQELYNVEPSLAMIERRLHQGKQVSKRWGVLSGHQRGAVISESDSLQTLIAQRFCMTSDCRFSSRCVRGLSNRKARCLFTIVPFGHVNRSV